MVQLGSAGLCTVRRMVAGIKLGVDRGGARDGVVDDGGGDARGWGRHCSRMCSSSTKVVHGVGGSIHASGDFFSFSFLWF